MTPILVQVEWGVHMWKHTSDAKYILINEEAEIPKYEPNTKSPIKGKKPVKIQK